MANPNPNQQLQDALDRLAKSIKSAEDTLADTLIKYTGIQSIFVRGYEVQSTLLKRNTTVNEQVVSNLSPLAPLISNLETSLALFDAGLEDNRKELGDFINRAGILGEDIGKLTTGLRQLRFSLGLTRSEEATLAKNVMDAAAIYKTSTEGVITSLNKFGESLAILNRSQGGQTNDLVTRLAAMTDRLAPGELQGIFAPLLSQGGSSLQRLGLLGVQQEFGNIIDKVGSLDDVINILKQVVTARDIFVPEGIMAVQGGEVLRQITGLNLSQTNSAEKLIEILETQREALDRQASLNDALESLNTLMLSFKEPFAETVIGIAQSLDYLKTVFGTTFVQNLVKIVAWTTFILAIVSFLAAIKLAIGALFPIVGPIVLLSAFIVALVKVLGGIAISSGETAKNTGITAEQARAEQSKRERELAESYTRQQTSLLATLIRESGRTGTDGLMTSRNAEAQREKTVLTLQDILTQLQEVGAALSGSRPSPFRYP